MLFLHSLLTIHHARYWLCGVTLLAAQLAFGQADYAREKRWADEVTPAIVVGDAIQLELKSGRKFLAIYTSGAKAIAGVAVVHGMGLHPDWGLNNHLRTQLADQGYATLAVQMPVLAADAKAEQYSALFPEAAARLAVAVAYLRGKGMRKVAIVSHSMGARMANHFLTHPGEAQVEAWVAIGIPGEYAGPAVLKPPVLDLYGERDFPSVLANAEKRAAAVRTVRGSGQVQVAGADHFFAGREGELTRQVKLFLDRHLK